MGGSGTTSNSGESKSTAELLIELNRRGIRFPPTATRGDLEALLSNQRRSSRYTSRPQQTRVKEDPVVDSDMAFDADGRGAEVPLEAQSKDFNIEQKSESSTNSHRKPRTKRKMESKRSLWSKLYGTSKKTVKQGVFQTIPDYIAKTSDAATARLSQAAEKAARKARQATRSARDFLAEDEDDIRDVDFQYVKKDILIDVSAEPVVEVRRPRPEPYAPKKQRQYTDAASSYESYEREASTTPSYYPGEQSTVKAQQRRRRTSSTPSMSRSSPGSRTPRSREEGDDSTPVDPPSTFASHSNLFRLPPAKSSNDPTQEKSSPRAKSKSRKSGSRRIYSPYDELDLPSQVYRDSIDRFAEFFANTTDSILWGGFDSDVESDAVGASQPKTPKKKRAKVRSTSVRSEGGGKSWKDRVEERFDSMLGIHEEGEYYNRWASKDEEDELQEEGTDSLSLARGRARKRNRPRRKSRVYDKPFWDVENAVSSLFGKAPPAGYSGVGFGNLLPIIKTLAKSLVLLCSNACEWATVRGSLPQPVVVVGVTSCVVSARPGKRLLAMGVALLAFRIFGELIHEGLYGDEDWEDNDGDERNVE